MFVTGLNHANLRVRNPAATLAFFTEVLGMMLRLSAPDSKAGAGMLFDASGKDILHVGQAYGNYPTDEWRPFDPDAAGGPVHHIALACTEYDEVRRRLDILRISYAKGSAQTEGLKQLFVVEPSGVLLELNFHIL